MVYFFGIFNNRRVSQELQDGAWYMSRRRVCLQTRLGWCELRHRCQIVSQSVFLAREMYAERVQMLSPVWRGGLQLGLSQRVQRPRHVPFRKLHVRCRLRRSRLPVLYVHLMFCGRFCVGFSTKSFLRSSDFADLKCCAVGSFLSAL